MATGNPHFKVAPNAPRSSGSGFEMPVEADVLLASVGIVAVAFLVGIFVYWRRLKQEAKPDF